VLNPRGFAHAGLLAENLPVLAAFYENDVGLRLLERNEGSCIFDAGQNALFEIWSGGSSSPSRKSSERQSVRICFSVERLEPSIQDLRTRGVAPISEIGNYLGTRWVHYVDPEGNAFGLVDLHGSV
jgi:predicted enzyme related to lactoylglutathione lyase